MGGFGLIFSRDMREVAGTAAFRVIAGVLALFAVSLAVATAGIVIASATGSTAPSLSLTIGTMLYFATLLPFLAFLWAFAGASLAKEKASGHLETLLATPLSARSLWLAKTALVALPGLVAAALSSASIAIAMAASAKALPDPTIVAIPPPMTLVCLLGNPLLFSGLGALTTALALRSSPDAAIVPSFVLGFGLMAIVPASSALGIIDLGSWVFAAAYIAAGFIEWGLVLFLAGSMTKERLVLSSRED
jgi:ABC-2 type transport system permease protein